MHRAKSFLAFAEQEAQDNLGTSFPLCSKQDTELFGPCEREREKWSSRCALVLFRVGFCSGFLHGSGALPFRLSPVQSTVCVRKACSQARRCLLTA